MQHLQIPSQKVEFFGSAKIHLENWFVGKELGAKSEILSVLPITKKLKINIFATVYGHATVRNWILLWAWAISVVVAA
jgi:hypothetical protein